MRVRDLDLAQWDGGNGFYEKPVAPGARILYLERPGRLARRGFVSHFLVLNGRARLLVDNAAAVVGPGIAVTVEPGEDVSVLPEGKGGLLLIDLGAGQEVAPRPGGGMGPAGAGASEDAALDETDAGSPDSAVPRPTSAPVPVPFHRPQHAGGAEISIWPRLPLAPVPLGWPCEALRGRLFPAGCEGGP